MKAYIAITHEIKPNAGVNTSEKGWAQKEKAMQRYESIIFLTRVRKTLWQSATVIINVTDGKVEKNNGDPQPFSEILAYVADVYPDHYKKFIDECIREGLVTEEVA